MGISNVNKMTLPKRSNAYKNTGRNIVNIASNLQPSGAIVLGPSYHLPTADELALMHQPSHEESLALDAIRRMGTEIDTGSALEFLRGPHFGEPISSTSQTTTSTDRGLPPAAVSILKLWFLVHQADPYPTKEEKEQLIKETGLSMIQLKNWFSNIRKRHWHPIRTGSRRPRSHVEYVLLYNASSRQNSSPASSPMSTEDDDTDYYMTGLDEEDRSMKLQRLQVPMDASN
jgi:hypothetical protein